VENQVVGFFFGRQVPTFFHLVFLGPVPVRLIARRRESRHALSLHEEHHLTSPAKRDRGAQVMEIRLHCAAKFSPDETARRVCAERLWCPV